MIKNSDLKECHSLKVKGWQMKYKSPHPLGNEVTEWTPTDCTMSAAEYFVQELFSQADNDSDYHHKVAEVKRQLENGQCQYSPEELAIRILAWSGAL